MTEVIGVRFRGGTKEYYFDPHGLTVAPGEGVIVETAQGVEYASCLSGNHMVDDSAVVQPLRAVVRVATENDRRTVQMNRQREKDALGICQRKVAEHGLEMKLVRVECSFDGSKIIFFFTADGRVDFRELVRDLAGTFRARIELRQIGVRDEAKMLGGVGICGRPFCCAQFLDDFVPVSIKMAKTQNLSLNPTKISGACGRLMCCLKYEQEAYEDALRRMPRQESFVLTPDGTGNVGSVDLLRETVSVRLDDAPDSPKRYQNCEVRVLRSGKGSRDGIEVPSERPPRFVPVREVDPAELPPVIYSTVDFFPPEPAEDAAPSAPEKRRSRRGGRGRKRTAKPETAQSAPQSAAPKATQKPKPAKAKSDAPKGAPAKPAAPKKQSRPAPPKAEQPAAAAADGEKSAPRRRNHRRGGRNHRRGNGGAPKADE